MFQGSENLQKCVKNVKNMKNSKFSHEKMAKLWNFQCFSWKLGCPIAKTLQLGVCVKWPIFTFFRTLQDRYVFFRGFSVPVTGHEIGYVNKRVCFSKLACQGYWKPRYPEVPENTLFWGSKTPQIGPWPPVEASNSTKSKKRVFWLKRLARRFLT